MLYLGPLVHEALDDPEGVSSELRSALGEMSSVSFNTPTFVVDIITFFFKLNFAPVQMLLPGGRVWGTQCGSGTRWWRR